MIKLRLCCTSNMLSSLLINKIKDAAFLKQIDIDIKLMPDGLITTSVTNENIDAILLSPQMDRRLKDVKGICNSHGVAVGIMSMQDYGFMNGNGILEQVLNLIDELKNSPVNPEPSKDSNTNSEENINDTVKHNENSNIENQNITVSTEADQMSTESETESSDETNNIIANNVNVNSEVFVSSVNINTVSSDDTNNSSIKKPTSNTDNSLYVYNSIELNTNNYNGGNEMINKIKDLLLKAENEVYMNTNMDINLFAEELNEISQRGVRVTAVAAEKYEYDELQIDKLYTYSNDKAKNNVPKISLVVDKRTALVSDQKATDENSINFTITDNEILVDSVTKNIDNYIYILKLRDNINFKLKDN